MAEPLSRETTIDGQRTSHVWGGNLNDEDKVEDRTSSVSWGPHVKECQAARNEQRQWASKAMSQSNEELGAPPDTDTF
jgi:hypothetical protein